jgi:peptidoglycan hydrolase-like protein with peptidoglycan-binding domain
MRRGNEGANVLQFQNSLVTLGDLTQQQLNTGPGIFGGQTEAAVKSLQVRNGLPATGVFDEATRAALQKEVAQSGAPRSAPTATTSTAATPAATSAPSWARPRTGSTSSVIRW